MYRTIKESSLYFTTYNVKGSIFYNMNFPSKLIKPVVGFQNILPTINLSNKSQKKDPEEITAIYGSVTIKITEPTIKFKVSLMK